MAEDALSYPRWIINRIHRHMNARAMLLLRSRRCMTCAEAVESYDQVGGCVYADPCGHRQYRGRVPK